MFLVVQDRGFAGRCAGDDGVGAVANLEFDQLPKFFIIDGAVLVHGRDQRHAGTGIDEFLHNRASNS